MQPVTQIRINTCMLVIDPTTTPPLSNNMEWQYLWALAELDDKNTKLLEAIKHNIESESFTANLTPVDLTPMDLRLDSWLLRVSDDAYDFLIALETIDDYLESSSRVETMFNAMKSAGVLLANWIWCQ